MMSLHHILKGMVFVILINKAEAQAVRKKLGDWVGITRTCKQKSQRHHYWCATEPGVEEFIQKFRNKGAKHVKAAGASAGKRKA